MNAQTQVRNRFSFDHFQKMVLDLSKINRNKSVSSFSANLAKTSLSLSSSSDFDLNYWSFKYVIILYCKVETVETWSHNETVTNSQCRERWQLNVILNYA